MISFRQQPWATLALVPLAAVLFGTDWGRGGTWFPESEFPLSLAAAAGAGETEPADSAATVARPLARRQDGTVWSDAVVIPVGRALQVRLPFAMRILQIELQASGDDSYQVAASAGDAAFSPIWSAARVAPFTDHLRTRQSPPLGATGAVRALRIIPLGGNGLYSVSSLSVRYAAADTRLSHRQVLIPFVLGLWLALVAADVALAGSPARTAGWRALPGALLRVWSRYDVAICTLIVCVVLFRVDRELLLPFAFVGAIAGLAAAIRYGARHFSLKLAWMLAVAVLLVLAFQTAAGWLLARRVMAMHDLSVDHRMLPDGRDINADGIRFRGDASILREDDFVVVAMGDSYTFGYNLRYEQAYPYVLEALLGARQCRQRVRAVNFGWTSSSPLLSYRLLRDIGRQYKPDLIIYNLDVTDFHDDLRFEGLLAQEGRYELPTGLAVWKALIGVTFLRDWVPAVREWWTRRARSAALGTSLEEVINGPKFFVTSQPLARSRPWIERGVMRNLRAIHDYASGELKAGMLLMISPRPFQYSAQESRHNWERLEYEVLGPHAQAPFRYFAEVRDGLPYKVLDLLPAFQATRRFPLFAVIDPHWNVDGARFVAEQVADYLIKEGLVPCR